jgi:hypothetical protein
MVGAVAISQTETDETMTECECSEDYGPCEDHCEVMAQRAGASTYTADELAAVFLGDVAALFEYYGRPVPTGDHYETAAIYWEATYHDGGWAPDSGAVALSPVVFARWSDGDLSQWLSDAITGAESDLADLGLSVFWDDGYVISRLIGGPLAE